MKRIVAFHLLLVLALTAVGQAKNGSAKLIRDLAVQVDGKLAEWDGHWHTVGDQDALWSYAVTYDDQHLFVATKVIEPALQLEAAAHGVAIMINNQGKKKHGMQFIFPVPDAETIRSMLESGDFSATHVKTALIEGSRGYKVKDFPKIVDGMLSLRNSYGLHAIAKIDDSDHLLYESAIPLAQLGLVEGENTIAIQIALQNRWDIGAMSKARPQQRTLSPNKGTARVKSPYKGNTSVWIVDKIQVKKD
ncbi:MULTISPECIES: hypothetical protein [Sphingobacterium]|uniref:Uncharacterized protein n=1 Tax=Sphingobacterium populi TaxID=1812824 RepID=A0ABW5UD08_9SPHI|nr:hypothetical protein [Sphingobacterium sp. CFCC 11742]